MIHLNRFSVGILFNWVVRHKLQTFIYVVRDGTDKIGKLLAPAISIIKTK